MNNAISRLIEDLRDLETNLEANIKEQRAKFRYELRETKVIFERQVLEQHRKFKSSIGQYFSSARILSVLSAPFVYAMIIPFVLLDLSVSIYQAVCFRLWQLPRFKRSDYIIIDRHLLGYLNGIEKLNCIFCGYVNGVIAFTRDVSGRTEEYWCPIKHARSMQSPHRDYYNFLDYGDASAWRSLSDEQEKNDH